MKVFFQYYTFGQTKWKYFFNIIKNLLLAKLRVRIFFQYYTFGQTKWKPFFNIMLLAKLSESIFSILYFWPSTAAIFYSLADLSIIDLNFNSAPHWSVDVTWPNPRAVIGGDRHTLAMAEYTRPQTEMLSWDSFASFLENIDILLWVRNDYYSY